MTPKELAKRKQFLKLLIDSQESMKERNALTETGLSYLDGLKKAREILLSKKHKA